MNPLWVFNDSFNLSHLPCRLNGTFFGTFTSYDIKIMVPFNAECGTIAAGILWTIWSNVLPPALVQYSLTGEVADIFATRHDSSSFLTRLLSKLSSRALFSRKDVVQERQSLHPRRNSVRKTRQLLIRIYAFLIILNAVSFSFRQYVVWKTEGIIYIIWCLEMGISIPLMGLFAVPFAHYNKAKNI